jgi:hypothetical protein
MTPIDFLISWKRHKSLFSQLGTNPLVFSTFVVESAGFMTRTGPRESPLVNALPARSPAPDVPQPVQSRLLRIEELIRRDPAQRGLIASEPEFGPLCPGHLGRAALSLAAPSPPTPSLPAASPAGSLRQVGILTGFFVPSGNPPAAETDGPLGATCLARVLHDLGWHVTLITDECCRHAVSIAAVASGLKDDCVIALDHPAAQQDWLQAAQPHLSHLVSVERVGPSHTLQSFQRQGGQSAELLEDFTGTVPEDSRDRCHNMRGVVIDDWTAPLHRLFESARSAGIVTIGIGDGGNEIGMGSVPWNDIRRRLAGPQAGRIVCRVAADWNIIAGTSNWGALALGAAVALLEQRTDVLAIWTRNRHRDVLETLVSEGPAVDGVTGQRQQTVDGLPFLTYIQPWESILESLDVDISADS